MFLLSATYQIPLQDFSGVSAFTYLEKQVSFGPRNPSSGGHRACLVYLTEELRKFSSQVTTQPFLFKDPDTNNTLTLTNIIASFPGINHTEQKVLLAAHWDTRPRADRDPILEDRNKPIAGANDGASGVAVLLELSRVLSEHPPPVSIDIVLFDGEDFGKSGIRDHYLLGSKHFASNTKPSKYQWGVLLDMVGDRKVRFKKEGYSYKMLPDLVNRIWNRARNLNLTAFDNAVGQDIYDDHYPLIQAGIPIVDIIHTDLINNDYWHTTGDTVDKCSPESLAIAGRLLMSLVYDGI